MDDSKTCAHDPGGPAAPGGGAGRFAPSPTSELHLGNLRTALLAWLWARATGRRFLLRIEDLDQQRVAAAPEVARHQLDDLARIGIDWDEAPLRQSERIETYRELARGLDTYECFCTRKEIAAAAQAPNGGPGAPSHRPYPGTCARLSTQQANQRRLVRTPAIRVRARGALASAIDVHAGEVTGVVDDFVLFRADGTPAYNLAAVIDDALTGVDQVTRGDDLLESAPRQAWLARQLGFEAPGYVHVSLALNADGQRLAKRDGAVSLTALGAAGVPADQVLARICASTGLPGAPSAPAVLAAIGGPGQDAVRALDHPLAWTPWVVRGA